MWFTKDSAQSNTLFSECTYSLVDSYHSVFVNPTKLPLQKIFLLPVKQKSFDAIMLLYPIIVFRFINYKPYRLAIAHSIHVTNSFLRLNIEPRCPTWRKTCSSTLSRVVVKEWLQTYESLRNSFNTYLPTSSKKFRHALNITFRPRVYNRRIRSFQLGWVIMRKRM